MDSTTMKLQKTPIKNKSFSSKTVARCSEIMPEIKLQRFIFMQVIGDGSSFKGNDAHISLIAELSIDRSKNTPEFKVKQATKKQNEVPNEIANIYKTSYLVVKEYNLSPGIAGYPLSNYQFILEPGNVIKLGRVEYMVIEAKNEEETMTLRDTNHFD